MARKKRPSVEDELDRLRAATVDLGVADAHEALRQALRTGRALVAARAARIVQDASLEGFSTDLEAAFRRFLDDPDPVKSDPSCLAKLAAVEALDYAAHADAAPFLAATGHVQMEKAWGPPVDTAAGLRARGVLALGRLDYRDLSIVAGALLADAESPVRQAAAAALAATGRRDHAGPLLLRWRLGDGDPLVVMACMTGVLALAADAALPLLRRALHGGDEVARETAALALGQSVREDALDLLLEHVAAAPRAAERAPTLRALGLHRSERALHALLEVIASGAASDAEAAVAAAGTRRFDPGVRDRAHAAARRNDRADLAAALAAAFP